MYSVETIPGELATWVLRDHAADHTVTVVPARGGMVTGFRTDREVLYLDPATLADRTKNVRGGIPVLFPIAGRLRGDTYEAGGIPRVMKQHGFARNRAWAVRGTDTTRDARITLGLASDDATREVFPWDFDVRLTYALAGGMLVIEQEVANTGAQPLPLHAGFHPYFRVDDGCKRGASVETDATLAYDNRTGATGPFHGMDLAAPEVDMHLLDHTPRTTRLHLGDGRAVRIDMDAAFTTLVVWTLGGRDFVCVEPWTAPGDALNTGAGLAHVAPGETRRLRWSITPEGHPG